MATAVYVIDQSAFASLDRRHRLIYAPLQGQVSQLLLPATLRDISRDGTVIVAMNRREKEPLFRLRSEAIVELIHLLGQPGISQATINHTAVTAI